MPVTQLSQQQAGSTATTGADPGQFSPLSSPSLLYLFAANSISGAAQGITMVSIPWYLVNASSSGTQLNTGMLALVTLVSSLWTLYAGTLIDRHCRRSLFMGNNLFGLGLLGASALLGWATGGVHPVSAIIVFAGTFFIYNLHYPTLYAYVQGHFHPAHYARVNSAIEMQAQVTNTVGMMLGSLLISGTADLAWLPAWLRLAPWPLHAIFALNAATYLAGLFFIVRIAPQRSIHPPGPQVPVWQRVQQGFGYLRQQRPLLVFGLCSHLVFFGSLLLLQLLLPVYLRHILHAPGAYMALSEGAYAAGALLAGWAVGRYSVRLSRLHKARVIMGFLLVAAACLVALSVWHHRYLLLALSALLGIATSTSRILRVTFILRSVPNWIIGRVNTFFTVANSMERLAFILLYALPWFSAAGNEGRATTALLLLAAVLAGGCLMLWRWLPRLSRDAAYG